jgi:hypothetical protein
MKTTVLVISFVGLISTTLSLPASIEDRAPPGCTSNIVPNADATISAINSWNEDVMMVNAFLNTADSLSGTALSDAATTAFAFANNEPAELGILRLRSGAPRVHFRPLGPAPRVPAGWGGFYIKRRTRPAGTQWVAKTPPRDIHVILSLIGPSN